jgi:hypothetical protein
VQARTFCAPGSIARAVEHVAMGARRADRATTAVDVASLIPCAVAKTAAASRDALRPAVGLYAGFFPRYNRLLAQAGFGDAVRDIKEAFDRGGRDAAATKVPGRSSTPSPSRAHPRRVVSASMHTGAQDWRFPS